MACLAVITTVRLDPAAIGIHGVNFRSGSHPQRISRLEQDSPIAQNVGRKKICRTVGESQRLFAGRVHSFDYESARALVRIYDAIVGQIKRPNAIFSAGCDAPRRSAVERDLPDLP